MSFLPKLVRPSLSMSLSSTTASAIAGPSRLPLTTLRSRLPILSSFPSSSSSFSTSAPALLKQKLKSHSGSKKRFFPNASGMFKRAQTGKSHLNTPFSTARINRLAKAVYVTKTQAKKLRKLLPYA